MSENRKYNKFLDEIIKEVEEELEESSATGNVAGYETPNAFGNDSKKSKDKTKKVSTQAGYTVVDDNIRNINELSKDDLIKNIIHNVIVNAKSGQSRVSVDGLLHYVTKSGIKDISKQDIIQVAKTIPNVKFKNNTIFVESINEASFSKPNAEAKKKLKGMYKLPAKQFGQTNDYVYYDKSKKQWWFVATDGDLMSLNNDYYLKQIGDYVKKNDININESTGHKEIDKIYKNKEHLMHYLYYDWNREFPMFNDKDIIILRAILSKTPNLRQAESLLKDVKKSRKLQDSIKQMAMDIKTETVDESNDRDYAAEYQARKKDYYKKYQSSDKAKKYRAELNQYNREKGTYGNGDGLDASHKGGKIVGFETETKNRSRKEKSRLKKESFEDNHDIYTKEFSKRGFKWKDDRGFDMWYKDYPLGRFVVSYEGKSSTNRYTYHIFFNPFPKYKTHFFGLIKSKDRKLGNQIDYKQDIVDFGEGLFKIDDSVFMKKLFKEVDDAEKQVKKITKVDYLSYKDSERVSHPAVSETHKGGKIVGFETESKNRSRKEKSRLKKEDINEASIPKPIQSLIDIMVAKKIQRQTVNIKDKSKHDMFMKDVQPAIDKKLLMIKHNPIKDTEMWISLGPESQKLIEAKTPKRKNRWLELKNDESMHGHKKLAVGLKELKYQLREVEKFLGWYNKLKNINELDSDSYWKRTNSNIYKIKERLVNIVKKIQEIEK